MTEHYAAAPLVRLAGEERVVWSVLDPAAVGLLRRAAEMEFANDHLSALLASARLALGEGDMEELHRLLGIAGG